MLSNRNSDVIQQRTPTSVAGPAPPTIVSPGTWIWTGACWPIWAFFAPTLARCTISFLSPSCIPFKPAIAWSNTIDHVFHSICMTNITKKIFRRSNQKQIHAMALIMQVKEDARQLITLIRYQQQRTCWKTWR